MVQNLRGGRTVARACRRIRRRRRAVARAVVRNQRIRWKVSRCLSHLNMALKQRIIALLLNRSKQKEKWALRQDSRSLQKVCIKKLFSNPYAICSFKRISAVAKLDARSFFLSLFVVGMRLKAIDLKNKSMKDHLRLLPRRRIRPAMKRRKKDLACCLNDVLYFQLATKLVGYRDHWSTTKLEN